MPSRELIHRLAKVLIAAAWADGELDVEEVNIMKDLLFRLPRGSGSERLTFTALEWAEIEMYLESPVLAQERARLVGDLLDALQTAEDKQFVLSLLDDLIHADGVVSADDELVVQEVREAIDRVDMGFFSGLSRLLGGAFQRRSTAAASAPNRERFRDDFLQNKVYYGVRRRLELEEGVPMRISEERLRRLCALSGLLAHIAQVDAPVTDAERTAARGPLQEIWGLDPDEAAFLVDVALAEISPRMDSLRLVGELSSALAPEEVSAFLQLLFNVAAADGFVSNAEMDAIYELARSLGVPHRQFIDAKLQVPPELRQS